MVTSTPPTLETPELMRRRLKVALRQARDTAGITQQDVADKLDWSVSKIIRIEQGVVGVSTTDLRALLSLYRIDDPAEVAALVDLARGAKKQEWTQYKGVYAKESLSLFGTEGAARTMYKYEPTYVPGLLQTEEYARALLLGLGRSESDVDLLVAARLERQDLLEREVRPVLDFVLSEAVLSWAVGGPGVMRNQLKHIMEVAEQPNVFVRVLPFSAGAHPGMRGAFTILDFADPELDDVLYLENAGGVTITREQPEQIANYRATHSRLKDIATDPADLSRFVTAISEARF